MPTSNDLIVQAINAVQNLNSLVSIDDIGVIAPELGNYPTSIDSNVVPIALTNTAAGSLVNLKCSNTSVELLMSVTVYAEPFAQGFLGKIFEKIYRLGDAFRCVYLNGENYLYSDGKAKMLVDESGVQIYISSAEPVNFTGYRVPPLEYPVGSGVFFHGFELSQFRVIAKDGGGC